MYMYIYIYIYIAIDVAVAIATDLVIAMNIAIVLGGSTGEAGPGMHQARCTRPSQRG